MTMGGRDSLRAGIHEREVRDVAAIVGGAPASNAQLALMALVELGSETIGVEAYRIACEGLIPCGRWKDGALRYYRERC